MSLNKTKTQDKLMCSALYASIFLPLLSWAPLIWLIVMNVRRTYVKDFVRYHCYQALLFNMIVFFLPQLLALLVSFFTNILALFGIFSNNILVLQNFVGWLINVYYVFIQMVALYAIIWTARGKFTYIPPISQAVNLLLR